MVAGEEGLSIARVRDVKMQEFGLPVDLQGRVVVELYSGDDCDSIGEGVRKKGGTYVSVDKNYDGGGLPFKWDVLNFLRGVSDGSADYVVMAYPPWFGKANFGIDISRAVPVLVESMRILKAQKGAFVAIGVGIREDDAGILLTELHLEPSKWFFEYGGGWRRGVLC